MACCYLLTAVAELTLSAYPLIERFGYWSTRLHVLPQVISTCQDEKAALLRAKLLNIHGQLCRRTHRLADATAAHEEAAKIAQEHASPESLIEAQFNLSDNYRLLRQYDQAEALGKAVLQTAQALPGNEKWQASLLNTLGLVAWEQSKLALAQDRLESAVAVWRVVDNKTELARTLNNLANVLAARGKTELALETFLETVDLLRATHNELDRSRVQLSLGTMYFNQEQYEQAEAAFRQANSLALRQSGDEALQGIQAHNLGNALLHLGRYKEAEIHLRQSLALWRKVHDGLMMINTMGTLAEVMAKLQVIKEAGKLYDAALGLLCEFDNAMAKRLQKEFATKRAQLPK